MRTRAVHLAVAIAALSACVVFDTNPRYTDPAAESYSVKRVEVAVDGAEPATVEGAEVSSAFFGAAEVKPLIGRFFIAPEHEDAPTPVAVISYRWWSERFDSSPEVIGKNIRIDNARTVIVGVTPRGFDVPKGVSLWLPQKTR